MNQLTESPPPAQEAPTSNSRAPYVTPQLEIHESWVLTTGVSTPLDGLLHQLPGRSS